MKTKLAFLFFFPLVLAAQYPKYEVTCYTTDDGLAHQTVTGIVQAHDGFMWFGTEAGVSRFDGNDFFNLATGYKEKYSIKGQTRAIMEDHAGRIWMGNVPAGLDIYDPATDQMFSFSSDPFNPRTLSSNSIYALYEDESHRVWIGTSHGLNRVDFQSEDSLAATRFFPFEEDSILKAGETIRAICPEGKKGLWVVTPSALFRFDLLTERFTPLSELLLPSGVFPSQRLEYAMVDSRGQLWVGTEGDGLLVFDPQTRNLRQYRNEPGRPGSLRDNMVYSLAEDSQDRIWVGTNSGLCVLDPEKGHFYSIGYDKANNSGVPPSEVSFLANGKDGQLWVGLVGGGVCQLSLRPDRVPSFFLPESFMTPENIGYMRCFWEDPKGNLWCGHSAWGVFYLEKQRNPQISAFSYSVSRHIPYDPTLSGGLSHPEVIAVYGDGLGALWIGVGRTGLNILTPEGMKYLRYPDDIPIPRIGNFFLSRDSTLWLAGWGGGLVKVIFPEDKWSYDDLKFEVLRHDPKDSTTLISSSIRCITEDPEGNLWMGTHGSGLDKFDPKTKTFTHFVSNAEDSSTILGDWIMGIRSDDSGYVWAGGSRGINRIDIRTNQVTPIPYPENTTPLTISLNIDRKNNIWGANSHLIKYDRSTKDFVLYSPGQGRQPDACGNCQYQNPSGWIYIGTINGFNYFFPDSLSLDSTLVDVKITGFQLFNAPVQVGQEDDRGKVLLPQPIHELSGLVLRHDQSLFALTFSALHYYNADQCRYAYRMKGLQGFEERWVEAGADNRRATFTGLNPGTYTFQVKASNHDGVWNETPTELKITILPPWWQTVWAYLAYALALAGLAFVIIRIFVIRERMRSEVALKSQEAAQLSELDQMRTRFFANISHEFRTPLTLILGPLEDWIQNPEKVLSMEVARTMRRNARRLLGLINQLLDLSRLEAGQLQLRAAPGDLAQDLRQMAAAFDSAATQKQIDYRIDIPDLPVEVSYDREKIETIVNNLLGNAFKFTPNGGAVGFQFRVSGLEFPVSGLEFPAWRKTDNSETQNPKLVTGNPKQETGNPKPETVLFSVSDTGPGISPEKLPHIFDRFYQADDTATRAFEGSGIGLALTRELVELHKGKIEVESEPGKGTTFRVWLPAGTRSAGSVVARPSRPAQKVEKSSPPEKLSKEIPITGLEDRATLAEGRDTILLVEDNADLRGYLRQSLQDHYQILEAENGRLGLEAATEQIPDLIISDVMMPEMDGFTFCAAAKTDERTSHIPVILLTALADKENRIEGLETGADDYLAKPFDAQELRVRVANLIALRQKLREKYQKQSPLSPAEIAVTSADQRFLEKVNEVLEVKHSDSDFTVEAFAGEMAVSRMQLHRKLTALTDQSPSELLKQFRLRRAEQLLKQKHASVSEIAYMVGFSTPAHFSRSFKEMYGVTPKSMTE